MDSCSRIENLSLEKLNDNGRMVIQNFLAWYREMFASCQNAETIEEEGYQCETINVKAFEVNERNLENILLPDINYQSDIGKSNNKTIEPLSAIPQSVADIVNCYSVR